MPENEPKDPISGMLEATIGVHELFTNLQDGGFTEEQALQIIGTMLAGMTKQ